jgi:hypothetical protein
VGAAGLLAKCGMFTGIPIFGQLSVVSALTVRRRVSALVCISEVFLFLFE